MFNQGTFKNYVDQSSPNLDPNPPRVDKNVQNGNPKTMNENGYNC